MSDYEFAAVEAAEVRPLRRALLHPSLPLDAVMTLNDTHHAARHIGAFKDGVLVAIGTIHPAPMPGGTPRNAWRLRDVAVEHGHRGKGLGALLVERLLEHANDNQGTVAWATVRKSAAGFFERCGFRRVDAPFVDPQEGPQYMMHTAIRPLTRPWGVD
jgi:GNAT superfamily N-acetyltransferase